MIPWVLLIWLPLHHGIQIGVVGFLIWLFVNSLLIQSSGGQSIGKMVFGIQLVHVTEVGERKEEYCQLPTFGRTFTRLSSPPLRHGLHALWLVQASHERSSPDLRRLDGQDDRHPSGNHRAERTAVLDRGTIYATKGMVAMTTPYEPGQRVAVLEPDVDGLRVREGLVQGIEGQRVVVTVERGTEAELHSVVVDDNGMSVDQTATIRIMPMDERLAAELERQGPGFLVPTSQRDTLDIAQNEEEAVQQMQARWERAQGQHHGQGYGYLCCPSRSLHAITAAVA